MPEIQVDWHSQEEADRLRDLRDRHGMVWRGVLLEGAKHAESIDLLKALTELHPALVTTLPDRSQSEHRDLNRSDIAEEVQEQVREQQRIRGTTEVPPSAFDEDGNADAQRQSESESACLPTSARDAERPPQFDVDRTRAYEQWDVEEARAIEEGELVNQHSAHDDVREVLRDEGLDGDHHPDDDALDEWDGHDDYFYNYGGDY